MEIIFEAKSKGESAWRKPPENTVSHGCDSLIMAIRQWARSDGRLRLKLKLNPYTTPIVINHPTGSTK